MFKSKKGKWIIVAGVVVVLAVIGAIASGGESEAATEPVADVVETQPEAVRVETLDELFTEMQIATDGTEAKSSARVDAIAAFAKNAAEQKNEDIGNEAVVFIANNHPNYFGSDEMMEKVMLCGFYLEHMDFGDRVTQLGQDAAQAVKYVYRGVETVEDAATQENLDQIMEIIESSKLD